MAKEPLPTVFTAPRPDGLRPRVRPPTAVPRHVAQTQVLPAQMWKKDEDDEEGLRKRYNLPTRAQLIAYWLSAFSLLALLGVLCFLLLQIDWPVGALLLSGGFAMGILFANCWSEAAQARVRIQIAKEAAEAEAERRKAHEFQERMHRERLRQPKITFNFGEHR